jgi:hypothetical protein
MLYVAVGMAHYDIKEPSLPKAVSVKHRSKFAALSLLMVIVPDS